MSAVSLGEFRQRGSANVRSSQTPETDPRLDLYRLIQLDESIVRLDDERSLRYHAVNESRAVVGYSQGFFFARRAARADLRVVAASDLTETDAQAPAIRWVEDIVARLGSQAQFDSDNLVAIQLPVKQRGWHKAQVWALPEFADEQARETADYPFQHFCWVPLIDNNQVAGGLLLCRNQPWQDHDVDSAGRVATLYARQLQVLKGRGKLLRKLAIGSRVGWLALVAAIGLCCVPISMTALAPVRVVAQSPFIVTAPVAGVVEAILVDPDGPVQEGDALVKFDDLELRNNLEIMTRQVEVARSHYTRISQSAIADARAKIGLMAAQSELKLAEAERDLAEERLQRTVLYAKKSGVAVYGAKHDWLGRPVQTGEAILQIANPQSVEYEVELPVKDSLLLGVGGEVKLYLDSDPLNARQSSIVSSSYSITVGEQGQSAYQLRARDDAESQSSEVVPRIGVRGTAQIYGDTVPFIYFILRRPITAFRQWTGI